MEVKILIVTSKSTARSECTTAFQSSIRDQYDGQTRRIVNYRCSNRRIPWAFTRQGLQTLTCLRKQFPGPQPHDGRDHPAYLAGFLRRHAVSPSCKDIRDGSLRHVRSHRYNEAKSRFRRSARSWIKKNEAGKSHGLSPLQT